MGVLFWFAKMFLKVLKPFVKIAIMESIIEAIMGIVGEEATPTDAEPEETTV